MSFTFSKTSLERRAGVDHRLIEIDDLALRLTVVDFGHPQDAGLRIAERQNELYQANLSMCDGYVKLSEHQLGMALDFYAYVDGAATWQTEPMALVACAYLQAASKLGYKIIWGGLWKRFPDMPHIQLIDN